MASKNDLIAGVTEPLGKQRTRVPDPIAEKGQGYFAQVSRGIPAFSHAFADREVGAAA